MSKNNDMKNKLDKLESQCNELAQKVEILLQNPSNLQQKIQLIQKTVNDNVLSNIQTKTQSLNDAYNQIFATNGNLSKKFIDEYNKINELYKYFYSQDSNGKTKRDILIQETEEFLNKYQELIGNDESKYDEFSNKKVELDKYYNKIFVSDENNKSLKDEIDDRLKELKNVEDEAKKVIWLSSDAGLAGGFHQMAESIKKNKTISFFVFIVALIAMFWLNRDIIGFKDLTITPTFILIKCIVNAPLVWIATVANLNLNKYTKLEQEYAHKESLAKSFERYKTEALKLDDASKEMLQKLIELNLEAFKKNPADSLDKIKSDGPVNNVVDSANNIVNNIKK